MRHTNRDHRQRLLIALRAVQHQGAENSQSQETAAIAQPSSTGGHCMNASRGMDTEARLLAIAAPSSSRIRVHVQLTSSAVVDMS